MLEGLPIPGQHGQRASQFPIPSQESQYIPSQHCWRASPSLAKRTSISLANTAGGSPHTWPRELVYPQPTLLGGLPIPGQENQDIPSQNYWRVGWSDLAFFVISESLHISVHQVYFYEFNSKKNWQLLLHMSQAQQSYQFQKITGILFFSFSFRKLPYT